MGPSPFQMPMRIVGIEKEAASGFGLEVELGFYQEGQTYHHVITLTYKLLTRLRSKLPI